MNLESQVGDVAAAGVKISPPLTVVGAVVLGYSLQDWAFIATIIYTALQAALLVRKFFKERAAERAEAALDVDK